ncbi:hypothetical protein, partial [Vibrio lentus]|uniref:hypothetical protein n=3 Tax=Vibrio TaxID=662 RepID=UPI001A7E19CF
CVCWLKIKARGQVSINFRLKSVKILSREVNHFKVLNGFNSFRSSDALRLSDLQKLYMQAYSSSNKSK